MQAEEIEAHLAELGQALQEMGLQRPIRILLVGGAGGAFMLTQIRNRLATNDIDIVFKDVDEYTIRINRDEINRPLANNGCGLPGNLPGGKAVGGIGQFHERLVRLR